MAQQFDYPKTETELREIQDKLYQHSKKNFNSLTGLSGICIPTARQRTDCKLGERR